MSVPTSGARLGPSIHTIVLHDAGPYPDHVVACLRELGCPDEPAQAFVRAAAAGSRPTIMYEVPPDEARRVIDALRGRQATVTAYPELAGDGGFPFPTPSGPQLASQPTAQPAAQAVGEPWSMPSPPATAAGSEQWTQSPSLVDDRPPSSEPGTPAMPGPGTVGMPGTPAMLPSTPSGVVQRYLTAYNSGDVGEVQRLFAREAVFDDTNGSVLASGQEGIGVLFSGLVERIPGRYVTVVSRLSLGSWVVDHQVAHTPGQPDQPSIATYLVVDGQIRRAHLLRE